MRCHPSDFTTEINTLHTSDTQHDSPIVARKLRTPVRRSQRDVTLQPTDRPLITRLLLSEPFPPRHPRAPVRREVVPARPEAVQGAFVQAVVERGDVGEELDVDGGAALVGVVLEVGVAQDLE